MKELYIILQVIIIGGIIVPTGAIQIAYSEFIKPISPGVEVPGTTVGDTDGASLGFYLISELNFLDVFLVFRYCMSKQYQINCFKRLL